MTRTIRRTRIANGASFILAYVNLVVGGGVAQSGYTILEYDFPVGLALVVALQLRLGDVAPGHQDPRRYSEYDSSPFHPVLPQKDSDFRFAAPRDTHPESQMKVAKQ